MNVSVEEFLGLFADRRSAGRVLGRQVGRYLERYRTEIKAPALVLAVPVGGIPVAEEVALAIGAPLGRYPGDLASGLAERTVIVVDDGLATGATARAVLHDVRRHGPAHVVFAAPVCADEAADELADLADAVLCARSAAGSAAVEEMLTRWNEGPRR